MHPKLKDHDIALRPSMEKFPSSHTDLEICSVTGPHPAFLNRQIIVLLEGLGVPKSVSEVLVDRVVSFVLVVWNA